MSSLCEEKCVFLFSFSPASSRLQSCKCVPWIFRTSGEMKQKQVMPSNILGGGFNFFSPLFGEDSHFDLSKGLKPLFKLGGFDFKIFQGLSPLTFTISEEFPGHLSLDEFRTLVHWLGAETWGGGEWSWSFLGGGFKRFLFSPLFWEDSHFD